MLWMPRTRVLRNLKISLSVFVLIQLGMDVHGSGPDRRFDFLDIGVRVAALQDGDKGTREHVQPKLERSKST